jgi:hypothetical protein
MNGPADREIAVFTDALQLPEHERAAYFKRACSGEAELRRAVEALLREYGQVGHFLEESPNAPATKAAAENARAERAGDRIGG